VCAVDHAGVWCVYRIAQLLAAIVALLPLYLNDAWAATETPGGTVNPWSAKGTMEERARDGELSAEYCSSAGYAYAAGGMRISSQECRELLAGELTRKTPSSLFYTAAFLETVVKGWPCASDANGTRRVECTAGGGDFFGRRNGLCGCETQTVVFPLHVESMVLGFDHSFDTPSSDYFGRFGSSVLSEYASNMSARLDGSAQLAGAAAMWTNLHYANGSRRRYESGEPLELPLAEWLLVANVSLEEANQDVRPDASGSRPPRRMSGVSLRVDVEYTNIDETTGKPVAGKTQIHANVRAEAETSTWVQAGQDTTWVVSPARPRSTPSEFHLVERQRMGVLVRFHISGRVYRLDYWLVLEVLINGLVLLTLAGKVADAVAFYCLPNGQSTVLRNKRQELVSKRSEFAEIGMKAALAARTYRTFDPDNNGSIEAVDLVRAFARVCKGDGSPWVPFEKAHAIAHAILLDADTDANQASGQVGLSYEEFMTCLEGDAINFGSYLKTLDKVPKKEAEQDATECQAAFEAERAALPAVTRPGANRDPSAIIHWPVRPLDLSEEERSERLQRKGQLELHLISASGLAPADDSFTSDPYLHATLGKKEAQSNMKEKTLEPVWGEVLRFGRMKLEKAVSKKLKMRLMDYDEGVFDSDDLLAKLNVSLECLVDHDGKTFTEDLKPQGSILFQVRWVELGS
jgi:hypothetical protein